MNCNSAQALISAHLDSELSSSDAKRLSTHLRDCSRCGAEYHEMKALKTLLSSAPAVEPDPAFEERLFARVLGATTAPKESWLGSWQLATGVGLAAASLTLLILSHVDGSNSRAHEQSAQASIARDIQQDQAALIGNDPYGGAPMVVPTAYAGP